MAGMHIPTAAVVRPAQRSIMGIIGARQRILNRGTARSNRHRQTCNPPHERWHRETQQKGLQHIQTSMQPIRNTWHTVGLVGSTLKVQITQNIRNGVKTCRLFWFYLPRFWDASAGAAATVSPSDSAKCIVSAWKSVICWADIFWMRPQNEYFHCVVFTVTSTACAAAAEPHRRSESEQS